MTTLHFRAKVTDGRVRVPQLKTSHLAERDNMLHDGAIARMQNSVKLNPRTYHIDEHPALTNLTPGAFIATIEVHLPTWREATRLIDMYRSIQSELYESGQGLLESEDNAVAHILAHHYGE